MKLLFVLVELVGAGLTVYLIVKAASARSSKRLNKWQPEINVLASGSEEVVLAKPGRRPVVIAEIESDLPDIDANAERNIAWEQAEKKAQEWNRNR